MAVFANYNDFAISTFHVLYFLMKVYFLLQKNLFSVKKEKWPGGMGVVNFDITMLL